jgi:hypothetical protein
MTRSPRVGAASVVVIAALACTACTTAATGTVVAASSSAPAAASPTTASHSAAQSASGTPLPTYDRTATPAATSGSLKRASLPRAAVLGAGWRSRVDLGSTEDGYTGNGTPSVARDPNDTVVALRPIGCAEESVYAVPLPLPRHALEVDYRHGPTGANGVGLALEFAGDADARRFFDIYTRSLALCRSGVGDTTRVTVLAAPGADAVATVTADPVERTTWRELVERSGRVVRLLAVEGARTPARAWPTVLAELRAR